jgi:hypothetical protein
VVSVIEAIAKLIPVGRGAWEIEGRSYPNLTVVNGEGQGGDSFVVSVDQGFHDELDKVQLMRAAPFRLLVTKDDRKGGKLKLKLLGFAA